MEGEKLKLEKKLFGDKSTNRNDERVCKNSEMHLNRNGYSKKTVKTQLGEIDVKVPRDRNGEY